MEAEKDPGEQGVQAEAPAGARPTRQPLSNMAPRQQLSGTAPLHADAAIASEQSKSLAHFQ